MNIANKRVLQQAQGQHLWKFSIPVISPQNTDFGKLIKIKKTKDFLGFFVRTFNTGDMVQKSWNQLESYVFEAYEMINSVEKAHKDDVLREL